LGLSYYTLNITRLCEIAPISNAAGEQNTVAHHPVNCKLPDIPRLPDSLGYVYGLHSITDTNTNMSSFLTDVFIHTHVTGMIATLLSES